MYKLLQQNNHWILPFEGMFVAQFRLDHQLSILLMKSEMSAIISIGQQFTYTTQDVERTLSPNNHLEIGQVFSILDRTVYGATAYNDGSLEFKFSDNFRLVVKPNEQYEAWTVAGERGLFVVSLPGGSLAIWHPKSL